MSLPVTTYGRPFPRRQAQFLAELLIRQESPLHSVLLGRRQEGKSDLLRQLQTILFEKADGPLPFRYVFESRRDPTEMARHFVASFCQQVRSFGMRQVELLGEPLARLEKEMARPGLPLALSELAQEFCLLPASEQPEFATALPAQFAYHDGRPLCLLLDDTDALAATPAELVYLSYLNDPRLSWLLAGRRPQLQAIAASRTLPVVSLEAFSLSEALSLAEDRCRQFEMPFSPAAWEDWFEMAGTSPCWVHRLIEAAVVTGQMVDSSEALGRVYLQELSFGSTGRWMEGRWRTVLANLSSVEQSSAGDKPGLKIAERLLQFPADGPGAGRVPPVLWEALVAEEWAENTPLGPATQLEMVERDWLELALSTAHSGRERAHAAFLQAFLLRTEGLRQWRKRDSLLPAIRKNLLDLPHTGQPAVSPHGSPPETKQPRFPAICSVATERVATAELFWCYGFRTGWPEERRDYPEAACLYLIALCRQEPPAAEVRQWSRRLQEEVRTLPVLGGAEKTSTSRTSGLGPRYEIWLALPRGASLTAVAGERRVRWEQLAQLLGEKEAPLAETLEPTLPLERGGNQSRWSELEARAQWLEEELATAREQFRSQTNQNLLAGKSLPVETPPPASAGEPPEVTSRLTLSVSLLLASAELLVLQSPSDAATLEAVREIQRRAETLTESLRRQGQSSSSQRSAPAPENPPSPAES